MKKMGLFDHLNAITVSKIDFDINNDEQAKSYNNYMINRFVSMTDMFVSVVNEINRYDVPKDVHYNYYKAVLPKRKYYFKYMKQKTDVDEHTRELLCEYFQCANGEIEQHLKILTKEQIKTITDVYKHRKSV